MTAYRTGQIVRLTAPAELFGGDLPAGKRMTVEAAWLLDGRELLNVVGDDGRRVCSLPAEAVAAIAATPAKRPAAKRKGGVLWD